MEVFRNRLIDTVISVASEMYVFDKILIHCCTIDEYGFRIIGLCEAALADLFVPARAVCVWSTGTSGRADEGTERHPDD